MQTLMGNVVSGPLVTLVGTGFDLRTGAGGGHLQLVSPNAMTLGELGSIPTLMTLSIEFVPEPATALLLAGG
jgi:hypothetical protein